MQLILFLHLRQARVPVLSLLVLSSLPALGKITAKRRYNNLHLLKKMKKQNALTLIEILISTVVLALVFLGLLNLFISGRKYLQHSQSRMGGSELGKIFLDPIFPIEVRQNDVGGNPVWWWKSGDPTTNNLTPKSITGNDVMAYTSMNGVAYTATSTVYTVDSTNILRGVQTKITWNESQ